MCSHCVENNQCIQYDTETGRSYRKDMSLFNDLKPKEAEVEASNKIEADPILDFIHNKSEDFGLARSIMEVVGSFCIAW